MTVTAADFRATFPVFSDPTKYSNAQIEFYIALGYKLHNADKWGSLLDFGVQLWVAHSLSMDARSAGANGPPGGITGNYTSMSGDGVSWSRDLGSVLSPDAGHWNMSSYGVRWRDLARMMGAGPIYVGAPNVYDAWLSGATQSAGPGWTGPWWNW